MTDGQETAPDIDFSKTDGLVPCVAQDALTGDVLMVAYMDREALNKTLESGFMHYHSRSRGRLWKKGEESGHVQKLVSLSVDCDGDTLLAVVDQTGPACHTGESTCFYSAVAGDGTGTVLEDLWRTLQSRKANPQDGSYTNKLLTNENLRLKKIAEEAAEFVMAAHKHDREQTVYEAADLFYHALTVLAAEGVEPHEVLKELARRRRGG